MNGRVLNIKNKIMPLKDKSKTKDYLRAWKDKNREKNLFQLARHRALKKGIEFNIEISDIVIPETCPILGLPIKKLIDGNRDLSPSLDRIDNAKGYIKGNIQVISFKANAMKLTANKDELINFSNWVRENYE
jgi:hypothetical protein